MPRFKHRPTDNGWISPEERDYGVRKQTDLILQDTPLLPVVGRRIMGTGEGVETRLDKILIQVAGYYPAVRQMIGDCVSFGWGKAIMLTLAADIFLRGENEQWPGYEICTEWLYGISRVVAGRGRLGNSDGSIGAWMAASVIPSGQGTLLRKIYEVKGKTVDLRKYSGKRAKDWGYKGLPLTLLEETADEHPVSQRCPLVQSYEEVRDAIANGYGVAVCSNQGFRDTRDKDGTLTPGPRWAHCMCFFGNNGDKRDPKCALDNSSWLDWCSGPNPDDLPIGCGWVRAEVVDRMARQGDTFLIPGWEGIKKRTDDFIWNPMGI